MSVHCLLFKTGCALIVAEWLVEGGGGGGGRA